MRSCFFIICLQFPFTTKTFKARSPKPKETRFSFNYEGNVKKNDTLFCFFSYLHEKLKPWN